MSSPIFTQPTRVSCILHMGRFVKVPKCIPFAVRLPEAWPRVGRFFTKDGGEKDAAKKRGGRLVNCEMKMGGW